MKKPEQDHMLSKTTKVTRVRDPPKKPFLEKQVQMTPERLELAWDNWRGQAEIASPSPYTVHTPSNTSLASSSYENSARQLSSKLSTKSGFGSGKRWGMFGCKKSSEASSVITPTPAVNEDSRRPVTHKKSKLLKNKTSLTKSTPNLKGPALGPAELGKVNAYYAPLPRLQPPHVPTVPRAPRIPHMTTTPTVAHDNIVAESLDSAVYFTVDPLWDTSKGNTADVYLLPFPGAATHISGMALEHPVEAIRKRAITHFSSAPHAAGCVTTTDDETSFLFLE